MFNLDFKYRPPKPPSRWQRFKWWVEDQGMWIIAIGFTLQFIAYIFLSLKGYHPILMPIFIGR